MTRMTLIHADFYYKFSLKLYLRAIYPIDKSQLKKAEQKDFYSALLKTTKHIRFRRYNT